MPIALGEICKLCEISSGAGLGNAELIGQARGISMSGTGAGNSKSPTPLQIPLAGGLGHHAKFVATRDGSGLRPPDFELLRPAVVIRRRPKRV